MEEKIPGTAIQTTPDRGGARLIAQDGHPDILISAQAPSVELALWHRAVPLCVDYWLKSLSPSEMPCGRILAHRDDFRAGLNDIFETSETPRSQGASLLVEDIAEIATLFADIAGTDLVDIGLGVIRDNACWKFHRDHVRLRILTTYLGDGTQYVTGPEAVRAIKEQRDFYGAIHHIPRFTVAMFKGTTDVPERGIVHRSPPIAGTGQTRLVLTLNEPSKISPEPWSNDAMTAMK